MPDGKLFQCGHCGDRRLTFSSGSLFAWDRSLRFLRTGNTRSVWYRNKSCRWNSALARLEDQNRELDASCPRRVAHDFYASRSRNQCGCAALVSQRRPPRMSAPYIRRPSVQMEEHDTGFADLSRVRRGVITATCDAASVAALTRAIVAPDLEESGYGLVVRSRCCNCQRAEAKGFAPAGFMEKSEQKRVKYSSIQKCTAEIHGSTTKQMSLRIKRLRQWLGNVVV